MLPLNPIWPPLHTRNGHISVNAWPIFIILVSIIKFPRVGNTSLKYSVTLSRVLTKLHRI